MTVSIYIPNLNTCISIITCSYSGKPGQPRRARASVYNYLLSLSGGPRPAACQGGRFARTASIIYVVNHRQACFHAQVHAGVFDSSAKVVPARLLELAAEDFLKLISVDRACCTSAVQIPVQPEHQVFKWYPLGWKFPHPLIIDGLHSGRARSRHTHPSGRSEDLSNK